MFFIFYSSPTVRNSSGVSGERRASACSFVHESIVTLFLWLFRLAYTSEAARDVHFGDMCTDLPVDTGTMHTRFPCCVSQTGNKNVAVTSHQRNIPRLCDVHRGAFVLQSAQMSGGVQSQIGRADYSSGLLTISWKESQLLNKFRAAFAGDLRGHRGISKAATGVASYLPTRCRRQGKFSTQRNLQAVPVATDLLLCGYDVAIKQQLQATSGQPHRLHL